MRCWHSCASLPNCRCRCVFQTTSNCGASIPASVMPWADPTTAQSARARSWVCASSPSTRPCLEGIWRTSQWRLRSPVPGRVHCLDAVRGREVLLRLWNVGCQYALWAEGSPSHGRSSRREVLRFQEPASTRASPRPKEAASCGGTGRARQSEALRSGRARRSRRVARQPRRSTTTSTWSTPAAST